MLKLKLQYSGYQMWKANSLKETLNLGKIEGRRRGWQRMRWLDDITDSMDMNLNKLWEIEEVRRAGSAIPPGVTTNLTHLRDWTTTTNGEVGRNQMCQESQVFLEVFPASPHFILWARTASHDHSSFKGHWESTAEDELSPRLGTCGPE